MALEHMERLARTEEETLPLDTLMAILEQFPYKLHISSADGVLVYANQRFREGLMEQTRTTAFGQYNILEDPALESWGIRDHVRRAFTGEVVLTQGVMFPGKELAGVVVGKDQAFQQVIQDIFSYPIRNVMGELTHVVTYFVPVSTTSRHRGVMAAKTCIETHWMEPFVHRNHRECCQAQSIQTFRAIPGRNGVHPPWLSS